MRTIRAIYLCESQKECDHLVNLLDDCGITATCEHVDSIDSIFEIPEPESYDCLLCSAGNGALQAIQDIREKALPLPVIFLGCGGDSEAYSEALNRGAFDAFDLRNDSAVYSRLGRAMGKCRELKGDSVDTSTLLARRSEEYLKLDNPVLIVRVDDRTILDVNPAAEELYGYTNEELIGHKTSLLYAYQADYLDMSRRCIDAMQEGNIFADGSYGKNKAGEVFSVFMHGFKLSEVHEGAPVAAILVRRLSEESIHEVNLSEEILKKINNVVLVANRSGAIVYASPSVRHVLGFEPEELLDDGWWRLTRDDTRQATGERDYIAECARGALPASKPYENRLRIKDGSYRWILRRDSRAASDHIIGVGTDITERKLAELELRRSRDELSQQTARLKNVNKELDAFAYSVSHDLKSPLRLITSYAELLAEDANEELGEQNLKFLKAICRNCDQMSDLIGDLLEFSRTSRTEMVCEQVDLSRIADQIADVLKHETPERTIEFQIEVGLFADADQSMVRVLLENLLRNAVKFTSTRENPKIEFGRYEEQGGFTYYVKDNGVGFDPAYLERLFQPFSRLHSSDQFTGTGLGLSIVRRIVERHGGRVWAMGEIDAGATFYFTLD